MMSHDIDLKSGLPERKDKDLPDEITAVCADLLRQYVQEDGLSENDPGDHRLERLMRMSEVFFSWYMQVVDFQQEKGPSAVVDWVTERNKDFIAHAQKYQELYAEVAHLSKAPYFVSAWAMAALVESSLVAYNKDGEIDFEAMTPEDKSEVQYVLRFGENLLQTFHTQVVTG